MGGAALQVVPPIAVGRVREEGRVAMKSDADGRHQPERLRLWSDPSPPGVAAGRSRTGAPQSGRPDAGERLSPRSSRPGTDSPWPDEVFAAPSAGLRVALQSRTGVRIDCDPQRWHDAPGPADLALLARTRDPVLDIGCGPGRLVHALVAAGRTALGIDTSAAAVASTRRRGAPAVRASVFGPVPSAGLWATALLLDGNIGIGGDAANLLRRTAGLVVDDGLILVEVDAPTQVSEDVEVCVDHDGRMGSWFPWSRIAAGDVPALALSAGLTVDEVWQHSGRWFAALGTGPFGAPAQQEAAS
jgi:SAM-dependent methyltransferase